jgi:hypothetical protein
MAYTDFTLESAEARFDLITVPGDLFPGLTPLPVPEWLRDLLARGQAVAALVSEKARLEFLVTPVLLACRDLVSGDLSIYSGQRLDVDADLGFTTPNYLQHDLGWASSGQPFSVGAPLGPALSLRWGWALGNLLGNGSAPRTGPDKGRCKVVAVHGFRQ